MDSAEYSRLFAVFQEKYADGVDVGDHYAVATRLKELLDDGRLPPKDQKGMKRLFTQVYKTCYDSGPSCRAVNEGGTSGAAGGDSSSTPIFTPVQLAGKYCLEDVAGAMDAKEALMEGFVYPFHFPALFRRPKGGILLYGPPGTGKTLLAKAAASELAESITFFAPQPGQLKGKFVGETGRNISRLFATAQQSVRGKIRKSIIFLDEVEAIGGVRTGEDAGMTASVTALLQQMDGIGSSPNVVVMAATNYPSQLDPAVNRRFDDRVFVDLPDQESIQYIIENALATEYNESMGTTLDAAVKRGAGWTCFARGQSGYNCTEEGIRGAQPCRFYEAIERYGHPENGLRQEDVEAISEECFQRFYSGSDVNRLVRHAINSAAKRAINPSATCDAIEDWYVYNPRNIGSIQVRNLPIKDSSRLTTYDIRGTDFYDRLPSGSTIDRPMYAALLKEAGRVPEEEGSISFQTPGSGI